MVTLNEILHIWRTGRAHGRLENVYNGLFTEPRVRVVIRSSGARYLSDTKSIYLKRNNRLKVPRYLNFG